MTEIPGTSMPSRPTVKQPNTTPNVPVAPVVTTAPIQDTETVQPVKPIIQSPPATQPVQPMTIQPQPAIAQEKPSEFQITNVDEIKKQKAQPTKREDPDPYEGVKYQTLNWWMGFGAIAGVAAAFLGIFHVQFFALAPLGPTLGAASWYVRKYARRYAKHIDAFS